MIREIVISIYLFIFKCFFMICKAFPLKNKVTFLVSFGDNAKYVYEEILHQNIQQEIVFLCKGSSLSLFKKYPALPVIPFETSFIDLLRSIYHLATSKKIIIDNYFGVLASTNFKTGVECIQLWHAAGAIKKFGLEDESNVNRSNRAHKRFLRVYEKFHKVVVGSDKMADIFKQVFALKDQNILRTGIPRTDFFFDENKHKAIISKLLDENPELTSKKVILYAPTYRDHQLDQFELKLDLEKMYQELSDEYVLLLRFHPAIKSSLENNELYSNFVYDYSSSRYDANELLLITDLLITDYSSIPYEFSLLNKPMIFFTYDIEQYKVERGLWEDFEETVPGPITKHTDEIITIIKDNLFDYQKVTSFSDIWNKYSNGISSQKLVDYIFKESQSDSDQRDKNSN
jgi:CDP-glycerol glycerophosphotransferase (TagB/SpsB family)